MSKKNFTVSDLPQTERPRERLREHGAQCLSLQELLAVVLGRGTPGESVIVTAQRLISRFGSAKTIGESSLEELQKIKGIGPAKASQLKAVFEIARRVAFEESAAGNSMKKNRSVCSPEEVYSMVKDKIRNYAKEHFYVISFDTRNKIIGKDNISIGILNANLVHPRETFEAAIKRHAAKIIIVHNHPSGDSEPSEDDIKITKHLVDSGKIIGIEVIDHIIITKNSYFSFKDKSLI